MSEFDWSGDIERKVEVGDRVKLINMPDDPHPIESGTLGTVTFVDERMGTIGVRWDNGSSLSMIMGVDTYEVLEEGKLTPSQKLDKTTKTEFKRKGVKLEEDKIEGGRADGKTVEYLTKKHNVSVDVIEKEVEVGIKIEMEHTNDPELAREITMDHIDEFHDYYTHKRYGLRASEKKLEKEKDVEEVTSIGGGALGTAPNQPLGWKKNESIKVKDLIKLMESTTTKNSGSFHNETDSPFDKNKDGWRWNDESWYDGGEIVDVVADVKTDWDDSDYDDNLSFTKEEFIRMVNLLNESGGGQVERPTRKLVDLYSYKKVIDTINSCENIGQLKTAFNMAQQFVKNNRLSTDDETFVTIQKLLNTKKLQLKSVGVIITKELDEATTFNSVMGHDGGNGLYITPIFAAKSDKDWKPSKKTMYPGGKIVQKIKNDGILTENRLGIFEINKVKYNKDGEFVKFDPKCVKYKNQPWCNQGAIDKPLILKKDISDNDVKEY